MYIIYVVTIMTNVISNVFLLFNDTLNSFSSHLVELMLSAFEEESFITLQYHNSRRETSIVIKCHLTYDSFNHLQF